MAIAAVLRLFRLDDNGFGTAYYAAGVRSMLQGAWLFFYNAFDPAGFISLDKPPVAFWIQTIFAAVLGYSGWSIHLPQALAGVASVAQNRDIQLNSVKATLEGGMDIQGILGIDSDVRNGFNGIKVTYDIDADATPEEIRAVVAQSQKRSAVYDAITNPTNVTVEVN